MLVVREEQDLGRLRVSCHHARVTGSAAISRVRREIFAMTFPIGEEDILGRAQSESRMQEICLSGCVSSEGWHVQQEKGLPGQESEAP